MTCASAQCQVRSSDSTQTRPRPWPQDLQLLATVSEWAPHGRSLIRGYIRSPGYAIWKTRGGGGRSAPSTCADVEHIVRTHDSGSWVCSQPPDRGVARFQIWNNSTVRVGQEDGRRWAVFEHPTARHNAESWNVQDDLPDWAILRLDQSGNVLPGR